MHLWSLLVDNRDWLFSGLGAGLILLVLGRLTRKKSHHGTGARGGNATVGGSGVAIGGQGGRNGNTGQGGAGGDSYVAGDGYARGGDGGDGGITGRPALGAPSPLSYGATHIDSLSDEFGIPQPGKGGDSYLSTIHHDGRDYSLNILLRLLNGPLPAIVNRPEVLDIVDAEFARRGCSGQQTWWELASMLFPNETATAIGHYDRSLGRAG